MTRPTFAALAGVGGFIAYVMIAVALADHVLHLQWLVQLVYVTFAGIAWVWPARKLMFWAARGG